MTLLVVAVTGLLLLGSPGMIILPWRQATYGSGSGSGSGSSGTSSGFGSGKLHLIDHLSLQPQLCEVAYIDSAWLDLPDMATMSLMLIVEPADA